MVNGLPSSKARAAEGERLLSWAFANFENVRLLTRNQPLETAPVWLGVDANVPLCAPADLLVTVPHGWQSRVKVALDYQAPIPAPVRAGQPIGQISISGASVADIQVPLVAGAAVERKSLPARAVAVLDHVVGGS